MTQDLNGQLRRQKAFRTRIVRFEVAKVSDEVCVSLSPAGIGPLFSVPRGFY
jgi:hypothetical protein